MDIDIKMLPGYVTKIELRSGNVRDEFFVNHIVGIGTLSPATSNKSGEIAKRVIESKRRMAMAYKRGEYE